MLDDNFRVIREILTILERSMDDSIFDTTNITSNALGISENRLKSILLLMVNAGLIFGSDIKRTSAGVSYIEEPQNIRISLKGLEYLRDNS